MLLVPRLLQHVTQQDLNGPDEACECPPERSLIFIDFSAM